MLKLSNSFGRYLTFPCENVLCSSNKTHVKKFTHFLKRNDLLCVSNVKSLLSLYFITPFVDTGQNSKFYGNNKKRYYPKKSSNNSNAAKKFKQMTEPQPKLNHEKNGGQCETNSSQNSTSGWDWRRTISDSPGISNSGVEWRKSSESRNADRNEDFRVPSDFRIWEQVSEKCNESNGNDFSFKILSYNVLAQYLLECHPYLYTECHPYNLKWKVRAAKLYDEILKLSPDILCLQEVQASHISSFYSKFEEIGYFGIFKQKTGQRQDGCAIYFKQSLFEMIDHVTVEYYQPELPLLNRDNIGIIVKLMPRNCHGHSLVVATTHLLYNPKRTDVRLAQLQVLLAEIDRFAYNGLGPNPGHVPVIITGDLNSTPDSAVVQLLDNGKVSASPFRDSSDWKKIGVTDNCQHLSVYLNRQKGRRTDFCMTKIYNSDYRDTLPDVDDPTPISNEYRPLFNSGLISHSHKFSSVYPKYKPDGCMEATTFQDYWVTVDYIYFSECNSLKLVERLRLPTAQECDVLRKLPNDVYGSDHLSLAAVFELKTTPSVFSLL